MSGGRHAEAGVTLIEIVVAVSLLSVLSVGMLTTVRMGFDGLHKTNSRLMENRRVAGAQRVIEQELSGFVPVKAPCSGGEGPPTPFAFFEGQPQSMRMVSTYSLQEAWRGQPRILELQVIGGEQGIGVRLDRKRVSLQRPGQRGTGVPGNGDRSFHRYDRAAIRSDSSLAAIVRARRQIGHGAVSPTWCEAGTPRSTNGCLRGGCRAGPLDCVSKWCLSEDNPARLRPLTITTAIPINRLPDISMRTRTKRSPASRGTALLAVLWLSAALAAIAMSLADTVRGEAERSATAVDGLRTRISPSAGCAARSFTWIGAARMPITRL